MKFVESIRHYIRVLPSGDVKRMLETMENDLNNKDAVGKDVIALLGRVNNLGRDFGKGIIHYMVKTKIFNEIHLEASDLLYRIE